MRRHIHRVSLGLGILGLAAAGAAAAFLAFASGSNAASSKSCTQQSSTQANCVVVSVVPGVLSSNQTGLIVAKFKNTFATATATHTVIGVTLPKIDAKDQPTSPALATATSVSSSAQPNGCPGPLTQKVSCSFGSVPGGATVVMYVQFQLTAAGKALTTMDPVLGTVSFDESNGNTGTTTNDSFKTYSAGTTIAPQIIGGAGGGQAGLCAVNPSQTGFTTDSNGQQANVGQLTGLAPGLPCTPVSGGVRGPTAAELKACGGSCPAPTSFVFFPVLANNETNNAAVLLTLNYPTLPPGVNSAKKTPLYEFVPDPTPKDPGQLKLVQVLKCGDTANLSPDSCLVGDPVKFGSSGVSFTVSVTGSDFDGSYVP